jgi:hypothetical protein
MIGDEPLCRPARLSSLAAQIPCAVQCAKLPRPLISIGRVFIYSTVRGFSKEPDGHLLNLGWRLAPVLTSARLAIGAWSVRRSVTLKDSAD